MKLFYRIPKSYQLPVIVALTALIVVFVGGFVNTIFPKGDISTAPNAEQASGILITPATSGQAGSLSAPSGASSSAAESAIAPPPPLSSIVTTAPTITSSPDSPISQEARAGGNNSSVDPYGETYSLPDSKHNHLAYAENDPSRNVPVGLFIRESYEREEFLDFEAADAFAIMRSAAAADGVSLMPVSGFRTINRQADLFKDQVKKLGSEREAAKLSAPPGHSEHHTGYAIDIGDVNAPNSDIKYSFQDTDAYIWLVNNAAAYGFEESFPDGNQQGVSFEPWHWRYVGSARAADVFRDSW